jgi:hypothetical protein
VASAVEGRNPLYFFIMPVLFLSLHLGYGAGFIRGIVKGLRSKGKATAYSGEVFIRRVTIGGPDGS